MVICVVENKRPLNKILNSKIFLEIKEELNQCTQWIKIRLVF